MSKSIRMLRAATIAVIAVLCMTAAFGCSTQTATVLTEEQQANRAFMEQVNENMSSFASLYDSFAEALSDDDAELAKQYAQKATETLEALQAIEAPDAMKDIQASYAEGCEKLVSAVNSYIELSESGLDTASQEYADRLAAIQQTYNEGMDKLQAGDSAAASKE